MLLNGVIPHFRPCHLLRFTCIIASISLEKKTLLFTRQPLIWSC
uniref:Uncharacterized protein n=1 Tax=Anguilla anguilla TaxID=7936 RepID=A0A0E9T0W4_ANGAN